jgi:hypothetical protein
MFAAIKTDQSRGVRAPNVSAEFGNSAKGPASRFSPQTNSARSTELKDERLASCYGA